MTDVAFVYVSDRVNRKDNFLRDYYEQVWEQHPGYRGSMPEDYMEIPLWVPVISGMLPDHHFTKDLYVVRQEWLAVSHLNYSHYKTPERTIFVASVMDVNKEIYRNLISKTQGNHWFLGGYTNPDYFSDLPNVLWLDDPKKLALHFYPIDTTAGPDYSLFSGIKHIPRLSMSEGCVHECTFCTIPRQITTYTEEEILAQIAGWSDTSFELVYLNDKTFGQAPNWEFAKIAGNYIQRINPGFMGFIAQTTVPYANRLVQTWTEDYHLRYLEVGVEMPDNVFLERMIKPYRMKHLDQLTSRIRLMKHHGVELGFIPNLIFGWPGATEEDYAKMIRWVEQNQDIISFINPYVLCDYEDSKGREEEVADINTNENSFERTWLTEEEKQVAWDAMQEIFSLTGA